jgi:hypothetical protein
VSKTDAAGLQDQDIHRGPDVSSSGFRGNLPPNIPGSYVIWDTASSQWLPLSPAEARERGITVYHVIVNSSDTPLAGFSGLGNLGIGVGAGDHPEEPISVDPAGARAPASSPAPSQQAPDAPSAEQPAAPAPDEAPSEPAAEYSEVPYFYESEPEDVFHPTRSFDTGSAAGNFLFNGIVGATSNVSSMILNAPFRLMTRINEGLRSIGFSDSEIEAMGYFGPGEVQEVGQFLREVSELDTVAQRAARLLEEAEPEISTFRAAPEAEITASQQARPVSSRPVEVEIPQRDPSLYRSASFDESGGYVTMNSGVTISAPRAGETLDLGYTIENGSITGAWWQQGAGTGSIARRGSYYSQSQNIAFELVDQFMHNDFTGTNFERFHIVPRFAARSGGGTQLANVLDTMGNITPGFGRGASGVNQGAWGQGFERLVRAFGRIDPNYVSVSIEYAPLPSNGPRIPMVFIGRIERTSGPAVVVVVPNQ